ncbi:hypothetical protein [Novosphingobium sp.]|uniref:hypothetical protein n=1 Tax=Novosphingobium sp. TaxID=1874826 RepID=UPI003D14E25A
MTLLRTTSVALGAALALALAQPAMAQTAPSHVLPDGTVPPALLEARKHMLEAPENMLTFHSMDQLFQTRTVPRAGPIAPLPHNDAALPRVAIGGQMLTEDQWEDRTYTSAFLVMRDGKILHEAIATTPMPARISYRFRWPRHSPRCLSASQSARARFIRSMIAPCNTCPN